MHILIPYAGVQGPRCTQALKSLELPRLRTLVQTWSPASESGTEATLTPLHESLHARALGLLVADGLVPWAARQAQDLQLPGAQETGWAWLTLCHWTINADHVEMSDPGGLAVSAEESGTLMEAMRSFFAEDGITLHKALDGRWLASGEVFRELPTASLERASGAQVDQWMPRQPQAKPLRRLQNEMQMLLYTHPINDVRAQQRKPAINSFWVSATGRLPNALPHNTDNVHYVDSLRQSALYDDALAWVAVWKNIDSTLLASFAERSAADGHGQLTLCGNNTAVTYTRGPQGLWNKIKNSVRKPDLSALLTSL